MFELFQIESSPECARVRQKLSELMLDFVVRQVSPDPAQRILLQRATGQRDVPVLLDPERGIIVTEADDIIDYLGEVQGTSTRDPGA
jgi:glutaredoxin 3